MIAAAGAGLRSVPQCVRADVLGDPGAAGNPADDPGGAVPVQPPPVRGDKERPFGALADRKLERPGGARGKRDGDHLAALMRVMTKVRWPRSRFCCPHKRLIDGRLRCAKTLPPPF
jgi:hypothetical protein